MSIFVRDPCGFICITLTYVAVFYADYVVIRWVIMQTMQNSLWAPFHVVMFNSVIFLLSFAHLRAMCSDPGAVPLIQSIEDLTDFNSGSETNFHQRDWTVCTRCESYRPPRAHHCRICKRCIRRMDHHCPWINNCVGEQNQKYFIQFLIYVGVLSMYAIVLVISSWLRACPECSTEVTLKQSRILHSVVLVLESALFGMFVLAILYDQLEAMANDETTVEQLQNSSGRGFGIHKLIMSKICRLPCYNTANLLESGGGAHSVQVVLVKSSGVSSNCPETPVKSSA